MNAGLLFLIIFFSMIAILGTALGILHLATTWNKKRKKRKSDLIKANYLFQCKNEECKKFFRQYQMILYKEKFSEYKCPHCEMKLKAVNAYRAHNYNDNYFMVDDENIDPWMNTHPDCMLIKKKEHKNVLETIEILKKLKKDEAAQKRFEEYNKFKVDFSWIENLNKEEKIKDL